MYHCFPTLVNDSKIRPVRKNPAAVGLFIYSISLVFLFQSFAVSTLAQVNVLTQHNDNARTGQNIQETILKPANVNANHFGKLFSLPVTGLVYAQPLYVNNLAIPNQGTHNVVIVATEGDFVYAFDADSNTGANAVPLWTASLLDAAHGAGAGEVPVSAGPLGCTDFSVRAQFGITSTPVIDLASGSIYVEAQSVVNSNYLHRLHALDITTGNEKTGSPVVIGATVAGKGDGSLGGNLEFSAKYQKNRTGLLLSNGMIYLGFGGLCTEPYHGWLFAYDQTTLQQKAVYNMTPNSQRGSLWNGGAGLAADATGNLYLATADGTFSQSPTLELGDAIVKMALNGSNLSVMDYFVPFNQASLNAGDSDVGSGGIVLLPDQLGAHPHTLVESGKEGRVYLVDRDNFTANSQHYCSGCAADSEIVQESTPGEVGTTYGLPAYWNNMTYWWGSGDVLKAIPLTNGTLDFTHRIRGSVYSLFPGATPSISANGNTDGIVWAVNSSQYGSPGPGPGPAVLFAFDATNILRELYSSTQAINSRDMAGYGVRFSVPTIANGKVYVGTQNELDVYGLLSSTPVIPTPVISPAAGTYSSPISVTITDSMHGAAIYYTVNGTDPHSFALRYTGPFTVNSWTTIKAIGVGAGYASSNVTSASYVIGNQPIMYEPEKLPFISSGPTHRIITWSGFSDGVGTTLDASKMGDNVSYTLNFAQAGTYNVKVGVKKYLTRGIWQLTVNGQTVGPFEDGYSASDSFAEFDLGNVTVGAAGNVKFTFTVVGRNSHSSGYTMAFDYFKLALQ